MSRLLSRLAAGALTLAALALAPQEAEAKFVFPYNHPDLEWYSIETEHFVVHYPVSKKSKEEGNEYWLTAEWSARKAAKVSEEMWAPMCAQFNYFLKEKIHIVMLNQSDALEGFTIPPWDWIEISAMQDNGFRRMRGGMEWFSDVLVHEFAHVVSLKANAVMSEGTQGVILGGLYSDGIRDMDSGAEVVIADSDSVFWTEGGAEYWSDNTGYNWWSSSRDTFIRTTVLQDRLITYDEWHTRAGKSTWWMDAERYYQQGYSFGQYLRQRFGEQTYNKFAIRNGERGWRLQWETVVEEVTGVDAETLYNDWVAYVKEKYNAQYDEVKARGEVLGRELYNMKAADWEYSDVDGREKWLDKKWYERERAREKTGRYLLQPRVSSDGKMFGHNTGGATVISQVDDSMFPAFTGYSQKDPAKLEKQVLLSTAVGAEFAAGWDFIPGKDSVVVVGPESMVPTNIVSNVSGVRLETDGYDWPQLWVFDLVTFEEEVNGKKVLTRERKKVLKKHEIMPEGSYRAIPNTKRGHEPSVSPDGNKVAYFEYGDGTMNLVVINMDGSDKRYLTSYQDGTWMQGVDWSPDGSTLVFSMMRNYQQNLFLIGADGNDLRPLTWDAWEDQDPHWAADGRIYFSSDPGGVFNIYSMDPKSGDTLQITNVIGAAQTPTLTSQGNLIYTYFTAYGWKMYGLAKSDFMNAPANGVFTTKVDEQVYKSSLAYVEDLSSFAAQTTKYRVKPSNFIAPTGIPSFRIENDAQTNFGLSAGAGVYAQDFVEKNAGQLEFSLGEDMFFRGIYWNQMWYPTLVLGAMHYQGKFSPGYLIDDDDDPSTTDDQHLADYKQNQNYQALFGFMFYPFNERFEANAFAQAWRFGFKDVGSTTFEPYMNEVELGLGGTFSNAFRSYYAPNTFTGRNIDLAYTHGITDIVYEQYGGVGVDDYMELDAYQYNKVELRWTENLRVPNLFGIPFMKQAKDHNHTIQIDALVGLVDRNVDLNDEFNAGGQHPYFWGPGTVRPNTQFAGYPQSSLSGETMGMVNLAYRFPINQYMAKKYGPLFIHGLYAQVAGTAGNLWSYTLPDGVETKRSMFDERIALDPSQVRREIPFVDKAYKNGNYMLFDASAEIRMESVVFHGMPWNSFARVAYGFNEIRGTGDVNGDGVYDTSENAIGDELSNETEKPGPRFYIGLGTGW